MTALLLTTALFAVTGSAAGASLSCPITTIVEGLAANVPVYSDADQVELVSPEGQSVIQPVDKGSAIFRLDKGVLGTYTINALVDGKVSGSITLDCVAAPKNLWSPVIYDANGRTNIFFSAKVLGDLAVYVNGVPVASQIDNDSTVSFESPGRSASITVKNVKFPVLFPGYRFIFPSFDYDYTDIVDGRFTSTRKLSVEVFDRSTTGGTPAGDNFFTDYIKAGMLKDHNVQVTYRPIPRWVEIDTINNLLAAHDAPDVCLTYNYPTIQSYGNKGDVIDLKPIVDQNLGYLGDLRKLITDDLIYYDLEPNTNKLWAIETRFFNIAGQKTFIREDWLAKLNLPEPATMAQFEATLRAFKANADTLLGENADKMVPFIINRDVAWSIIDMADSFLPAQMTDKELYIYGYDDRRVMMPNFKEAVRVLNRWYNEGLVWKNFALYPQGDTTGTNLMKSGYVGSFQNNVDSPYRDGDVGIQRTMARDVSSDAAYIAIATFENSEGVYRKYWGAPIDRKVFFPSTNKEPLAGLLYINFISADEHRIFLQIGLEGINHEVQPNGAIRTKAATGGHIMNSPMNVDLTMTCNSLCLTDPEITAKSLALSYAGIDPRYIIRTQDTSPYSIYYRKNAQIGIISAENDMGPTLIEKRDSFLSQAVIAPASMFDTVFDAGMREYLNSGGQAIIDERTAAWNKMYGTKEYLIR